VVAFDVNFPVSDGRDKPVSSRAVNDLEDLLRLEFPHDNAQAALEPSKCTVLSE
jgi:hypothetical protein